MTRITKRPQSILINIQDWQRETAVLTSTAAGVLLKLKLHFWCVGTIPDRDQALAQIAGCELREWKKVRKELEPLFIVMHGEWTRADWSNELDAAYEAINRASKAGKAAVTKRWELKKQSQPVYESNTNRIPSVHQSNAPDIPENAQNQNGAGGFIKSGTVTPENQYVLEKQGYLECGHDTYRIRPVYESNTPSILNISNTPKPKPPKAPSQGKAYLRAASFEEDVLIADQDLGIGGLQ